MPGRYSASEQYSLPDDIIKGMIVLRCNSILRGHSGVRMDIADFLMEVLAKDMMPLIPTRGSVSASGDLTPLAYLGGLLEGNPDIPVRITDRGDFQIVSADEALMRANMASLKLQGKEGLGLVNGTAPSSSAAALVVT
jgi:phenylalanine ammonia-lyase